MLATGRQTQRLRGVGRQLEHPIGKPASISHLAWKGLTINQLNVGVARIFLVEPPQSGLKIAGIQRLKHDQCLRI